MPSEEYIFESCPRTPGAKGPRFKDQKAIQSNLHSICMNWAEYLNHYLTETEDLFGKPEAMSDQTERAIVSSLAVSIARQYPKSLVAEEISVKKRGNKAKNASGRCDLWASIPELKANNAQFSFYLEAKIARKKPTKSDGLKTVLLGKYGISKLFRDYQKGQTNGRIDQRSPYPKVRKHPHYVIGLLITPIEQATETMRPVLHDVFERIHELQLHERFKRTSGKRIMGRFPTVALVTPSTAKGLCGMIASLTVLGSTSGLATKGSSSEDGPETEA